jgi:nicotinamidase-related amidase
MANAVIVVDMLRGFLEEGGPLYCGARARGIIPNVQRLLERESARGSRIFYLCDHHAPDDAEFKMFPPPLHSRNRGGGGHSRAGRLSRGGDA